MPDTQITVVHRSDKSGTTQNFVSYFKDQAPDSWTHELSENWPDIPGQQSAKGTSGVVTAVKQADGTIGYADFSQVGDLAPRPSRSARTTTRSPLTPVPRSSRIPRSTHPPRATTAWS